MTQQTEKKDLISIIIPTFNKLNEHFKKCIDSVIDNIGTHDVEVIVMANGCQDGTEDYVRQTYPDVCLISNSHSMGYTAAVNTALSFASGEFIVLLNDDTEIMKSEVDWLTILKKPFTDSEVAATGPFKKHDDVLCRSFLVFFCVMLRHKAFKEIGYLDPIFNPGFGEDMDACFKLESHGYKIVQVPSENALKFVPTSNQWGADFPIMHEGTATFKDYPGYQDIVKRNYEILAQEYKRKSVTVQPKDEYTVDMSTKNRYDSTLFSALYSVINQSVPPTKIIVGDDNKHPVDLRNIPRYKRLFDLCAQKNIQIEVLFTNDRGQVHNHQMVLDMANTQYVWRMDDDEIAPPDTAANMLEIMATNNYCAVGPLIIDPSMRLPNVSYTATRIYDVRRTGIFIPNPQWLENPEDYLTEHLYSSFMYRTDSRKHVSYCKELSKIGHREETMFSYSLYKFYNKPCAIDKRCKIHHIREEGGIRSYYDKSLWDADETVFAAFMAKNVDVTTINPLRTIILDCGIGDHFAFNSIFDKILKRDDADFFSSASYLIACCYPEVTNRLLENTNLAGRLYICSIADIQNVYGIRDEAFWDHNVYKFMAERNYKKHLSEAFLELHETISTKSIF